MKKSSLLIKEPPLTFSPTLAKKIGLNEAIAVQQLEYWINNPKSRGVVDEHGRKWVYNSYEEWQEDNFPFWSIPTIQRIFINLEKSGIVISSQLWAKRRDMRKFYRVDYESLDGLDDINLMPSDDIKLSPSTASKRVDVKYESKTTQRTTDISHVPDFKAMSIQEAYRLPTLRLYRDATGFFPGQPTWEYVHTFIVKNNISAERLKEAFTEWKIRGFKSDNVKGILEWAKDGIPADQKGKRKIGNNNQQKQPMSEPRGFDAARKFLERHGVDNG